MPETRRTAAAATTQRAALGRTLAATCAAHGARWADQWCIQWAKSTAIVHQPARNGRRQIVQQLRKAAPSSRNRSASDRLVVAHPCTKPQQPLAQRCANQRPIHVRHARPARMLCARSRPWRGAAAVAGLKKKFVQSIRNFKIRYNYGNNCIEGSEP
ncbi:alpha-amylase/subtilisin inhibitor-like [Dorcoceras hygrometricum]|uniref:Alpha-amylase/subtilisin inhibitor-like n=1 Tax=Dorcoceras hygrometricum TaxID=472368 RepID=A0A2Z7DEQ7_9LAMI|nr:alpha-amylase/subtilisin inhibitor-like [Dorcoceras hygrometricum]